MKAESNFLMQDNEDEYHVQWVMSIWKKNSKASQDCLSESLKGRRVPSQGRIGRQAIPAKPWRARVSLLRLRISTFTSSSTLPLPGFHDAAYGVWGTCLGTPRARRG